MTAHELRQLAGPALVALALTVAGALLGLRAERVLGDAHREMADARAALAQGHARLAHLADEGRELRERLPVYRRLVESGVVGAERRLDWIETIGRIRTQRGLPELRYRIEPRTLLRSLGGQPAPIDVYASALHLQLALLHEGDLLHFLADLRESRGALHAPRQCQIRRVAAPDAGRGKAPQLEADCRIDLITIVDRAVKL